LHHFNSDVASGKHRTGLSGKNTAGSWKFTALRSKGRGHFKVERLPRFRMLEGQIARMQRYTLPLPGASPVKRIAQNGVTPVARLNADLVVTTRLGLYNCFKRFNAFPSQFCSFSKWRIDNDRTEMFWLLFELIYPGPRAFWELRRCFEGITLLDRSLFKLAHEAGTGEFISGQYQESTGWPIQTMDDPEVALKLFFKDLLHIGMPHSVGLYHESCTLGNHNNVAV
jgi:hypothetical protein